MTLVAAPRLTIVKRRAAAALGCLTFASAAVAQTLQFQVADGAWHEKENWSTQRVPDLEDDVIIPVGATCRIWDVAECRSFDVRNSGVLRVEAGASLTIHADSLLIIGTLQLAGAPGAPATLIIAEDLTISGKATGIEMSYGRITRPPDRDPILSFVRAPGPGPTPPRIYGDGEIRVRLDNHAWVWATDAQRPLVLAGKPKSGSGEWQARDGGMLLVKCDVTGEADWRIHQGDASRIWVRRALSNLTGRIELLTGTMLIDQQFCTSGPLLAGAGVLRFRSREISSVGQPCPPGE